MSQNTSHAVMAQRREPPDSLDFFPTPPWATRALLTHVLWPTWIEGVSAWEPACGEGHMSEVLREYFGDVKASDVFPYGAGQALDFLDEIPFDKIGWVITNPPFKIAEDFALRGLEHADIGVALLVRSVWLEGTGRYARLFRPHPPSIVAQFCERVPMTKGRWDPNASTATSYAWVVWLKKPLFPGTRFEWIPPGCRIALTKPDDAARFGVRTASPLFAEPAREAADV